MTHLRNRITMLPAERRNKVVEGYEGYVSGTTFYGEGLPMYTFYMKNMQVFRTRVSRCGTWTRPTRRATSRGAV